jgi:hypothetical protein
MGFVRITQDSEYINSYKKGQISRLYTSEDDDGDRTYHVIGKFIKIQGSGKPLYQGLPIRRQDFEELTGDELKLAELIYG